MRGIKNAGLGHAGKRAVRTSSLACLLIMFALLVYFVPQPAYAQPDKMNWHVDSDMLIANITGNDGSRGYCADEAKLGPAGTTYTEWRWVSEADPKLLKGDPHGMSWLLAHCYPKTRTFGGTVVDAASAARISQAAVWMYQGDMAQNRYVKGHKLHVESCSQREADLAWALSQEAHHHDGEQGPWDRCSKIWLSPKNAVQNILSIPPEGSIAITKESAQVAISATSSSYSLQGARFGVFTDEACTHEVSSVMVDADGKGKIDGLAPGTYWIKETHAPSGFLLCTEAHQVQVEARNTAGVSCQEVPRFSIPSIVIKKLDSVAEKAQGDAALEGAEFRASFWPQGKNLEDEPARTWTLKTDAEGHIALDDAHKVSGDEWYKLNDGTIALPLGTLVIEETTAPEGYMLPTENRVVFPISADDSSATGATILQPATVAEEVIRGGVSIHKIDAHLQDVAGAGKARLEGATFSIVNDGKQPVVVNGTTANPGELVATLVTDSSGFASTSAHALPYGRYRIKETTPGTGYLLNADWEKTVTIKEDGRIVELTDENSCPNDVIRGDIAFVKQDGASSERLKNIPFKISSRTTGEWHIAVTDANGRLDTSSAFYPHSQNTNTNDAALLADGSFDEKRLVEGSGIWFSGHAHKTATPQDSVGALPYDDYLIEELPTTANSGKKLVSFGASITRNTFMVDLGTVSNVEGPRIATSLRTEDGERIVAENSSSFTLVDTVSFAGLTPGTSYVLTGTLMDYATQQPVQYAETEPIRFTPQFESGSIEVSFRIHALPEGVSRLVAFETLTQGDVEICSHKDFDDTEQTLLISHLRTTASSRHGRKLVSASDATELVDRVEFSGLIPKQSYVLTATLHKVGPHGEDAGVFCTETGEELTFTHEFTPEESEGVVEVPIHFDARTLQGQKVVVFERLQHKGKTVGKHEDIQDEGQTIEFENGWIPKTGDTTGFVWTTLALLGIASALGGYVLRVRRS